MPLSGDQKKQAAIEEQICAMAKVIGYFLHKNYSSLDGEQVKDLVHDVIIAAIEAVRRTEFQLHADTTLTTYVHSIARHKALDFLKYGKIRRHESLDHDVEKFLELQDDPKPDLADLDISKLAELVSRLGEPRDRILYLCYFEGYKVAEVAQELNMAPTQVSMHKFTALKQLRDWCEEEGITLAFMAVALWNLWRIIHDL